MTMYRHLSSENKHLSRIEDEKQKKLMMECENKLKNNGIAMTTIDNTNEIDTQVISLLEMHKSEKQK